MRYTNVCISANLFIVGGVHMGIEIVDLNDEQVEEIESRLDEYDKKHIS